MTRKFCFLISTALEKVTALIEEPESINTNIVRRHEQRMDKVLQHHSQEFSFWEETAHDNDDDSLIKGLNVAKADIAKMAVEWNEILALFEKHLFALNTLVDANVKRRIPFTNGMAKILELLEIGCLRDCTDFSI